MPVETFAGWVWRWHCWAGLVAAPTLLVVAVTGALYAFRVEIEDWQHADITFVALAGPPRPPSEQLAAVRAAHPGRFVARMVLSDDPARATTFLVNQIPRPDGADPRPSEFASVNPYTAEVIGERSNRSPFFGPVLRHRSVHRGRAGGEPLRRLAVAPAGAALGAAAAQGERLRVADEAARVAGIAWAGGAGGERRRDVATAPPTREAWHPPAGRVGGAGGRPSRRSWRAASCCPASARPSYSSPGPIGWFPICQGDGPVGPTRSSNRQPPDVPRDW